MSNIRAALDKLILLQAGLSISSPASIAVKKAYKYVPDRNISLPDTPCWMNTFTHVRRERHHGQRDDFYIVNCRLAVNDADLDRAADIATAFHEAFADALDGNVTLNGTVVVANLRGGDPTLVLVDWGGQSYVGLNEFVDLEIIETKTFA